MRATPDAQALEHREEALRLMRQYEATGLSEDALAAVVHALLAVESRLEEVADNVR